MDWEQMAAALDALAEIEIKIRKPGDWYVSQRLDIKQESVLCSILGNGRDPEEAVTDHWRQAVDELPDGQYLVTRPAWGEDKRRAVRWNGFMWADVTEPARKDAA